MDEEKGSEERRRSGDDGDGSCVALGRRSNLCWKRMEILIGQHAELPYWVVNPPLISDVRIAREMSSWYTRRMGSKFITVKFFRSYK